MSRLERSLHNVLRLSHRRWIQPIVLRTNQVPQLGILHKRVHAGEHTDQKPVHAFSESVSHHIIFPKGKQRTKCQVGPTHRTFSPTTFLSRYRGEAIEFSEVTVDDAFRGMIQWAG